MSSVIFGGRAVTAGGLHGHPVAVNVHGRAVPGRRCARNAPAPRNGLQGERKRKKQNAQGIGTHRATGVQVVQILTET
jgi:hypothetical protein